LALTVKKVWLLVHDYEIPDNYAYTCFREHFTPVLRVLPLGFGWLLGLFAWGVWLARRERLSWIPIGFAVLYGGAVVVFFIYDRYRIPLVLPLCMFAARGLVEAFDLAKKRDVLGLVAGALPVVALTILAFTPSSVSREQEVRDAYCVAQAGMMLYSAGQKAEAEPLLQFGIDHGQAAWVEKTRREVDEGDGGMP
jgi:hypothetical protein